MNVFGGSNFYISYCCECSANFSERHWLSIPFVLRECVNPELLHSVVAAKGNPDWSRLWHEILPTSLKRKHIATMAIYPWWYHHFSFRMKMTPFFPFKPSVSQGLKNVLENLFSSILAFYFSNPEIVEKNLGNLILTFLWC